MARKGTRAAQGSGTIRKKTIVKNGKSYTMWEARVTVGHNPGNGRQIQRSIYGKTQADVRKKMSEVVVALDSGTYHEPSKMTVGEWLNIWQTDYLGSVKPFTVLNYSQQIKNHIIPALGAIKLDILDTPTIQHFYNSLAKEGLMLPKHGKDGKALRDNGKIIYEKAAPMSPKTIKNIHGVLHKALQQAVKLGYIRYNPADACDLPRVERKEINPLDSDEISQLMKAMQGHKFEAILLTTLFTGMRRGEVCGLTWDCVDLEKGTIFINKQLQNIPGQPGEFRLVSTKNGRGRTIHPAPFVIEILKKHQIQQKATRLLVGPAWHDNGFVFCNDIGERLSPHTVYDNFKKIAKSIGLPDARLHDLRHSYAVAALQAGDDIKTVQGNLGHHTASFTLDVYGHVTEQMKDASAQRMEAYIKNITASGS